MIAPVRILIVDDHEIFAQSLLQGVESDPDLDVIGIADSGRAGVDRARVDHPDVVLMDFQLPDMTGARATELIRRERPGTKVIALTGRDGARSRRAMAEAGSSAWVSKTQTLAELLDVIHSVQTGSQGESRARVGLGPDARPTLEELELWYQPVIDLVSGSIRGFEGLVRWRHPTAGLIYPDAFLPAAEASGFIDDLSCWVAQRAVADLARWRGQRDSWDQAMRGEDLWVSVNMSPSSLANRSVIETITSSVVSSEIPPRALVVEVTETVLLEDDAETIACLDTLRSAGVRLALDDFGTGFSSLSYLRRFDFDVVKIDSSFTAELPYSDRSMVLVTAIQHLADAVGLVAIAEGIERDEQACALRAVGWLLGQGFLYSPAVDVDHCEAMLAGAPV